LNHLFTAAGLMSAQRTEGYMTQVTERMILRIGAEGADTVSAFKLVAITEQGTRHVIRQVDSLATLEDNSVMVVQPEGTRIDMENGGANLYVEFAPFQSAK